MAVILEIRGRKCGKVYRCNDENSGKRVKCPKCKNTLTIPKASSIEKRKETRAVISEASQSIQLSEALTSSKDISSYRVVYTEADPIEFALKRNLSVPLLDLSEDGLGFYIKVDQASQKLSKGSLIPISPAGKNKGAGKVAEGGI